MRSFIYSIIYYLGVFFINSRVLKRRAELKKTEFFSDVELDCLQTSKLRRLLTHAKTTCEYYSGILAEVDTENFNLDDLVTLPVLSKTTLRKNTNTFYSSVFCVDDLIESETSGSTGEAFIFYRDKGWDASHRAAIWRGLNQYNVQPWDRNLYLWGFVFDAKNKLKIRFFDFLQNRFRLFQIDRDEIKANLNKIKGVKYVSGYSSVIDTLVKIAEDSNISFPNIKLLKGTSEKIYSSYQKRAKRVLGIPIVSEYGAAETGIIAFTCPEGENHTIRENVIVECIDGRAVITNLDSFSLPIVRLDLGDYIELVNQDCPCGRHSQIVADVLGRVGVSIVGRSKEYPSLTLYYIFKELALFHGVSLSYQGVQSEKGVLKLLIFDKLDGEQSSLLMAVGKKYLPDLDLEIEQGMMDDRKSKTKDFISTLV